jgi:hypothetical protein
MREYLQQITLTDIIALGGLIIACVTLGWNILNEIRKTPKARVTAMVAKFFQQGNPRSGKDTLFSITVANIGSRPIRINNIGYVGYKWWWHPFKRQWYVIIPKQIPIYLKDGEQHSEDYVYLPEQFKEFLDHNINGLCVYDSAGRNHWMSRWRMLRLKRDIRKHLAKSRKDSQPSKR